MSELSAWYANLRWGETITCPHCMQLTDTFKCTHCGKSFTVFTGTVLATHARSLEDIHKLLKEVTSKKKLLYRSNYKQFEWSLLLKIHEIHTKQPPVIYKELKKDAGAYRSMHIKYICSLPVDLDILFLEVVNNKKKSFSMPVEELCYNESVLHEWNTDKEFHIEMADRLGLIASSSDNTLSDDEVALLVHCIQEGLYWQRSTNNEEHFQWLLEGNLQYAQEILLEKNKGLIVKIANDLYNGNKDISIQDYVQECNMALLDVIQYFDPDKGYKLSTYIVNPIKHRVIASVGKQDRTIYLPKKKRQEIANYINAEKALSIQLGRTPSTNETAQFMFENNTQYESVETLKNHIEDIRKTVWLNPISLDVPSDNEDDDMHNIVSDSISTDPTGDIAQDQMKKERFEIIIDQTLEYPLNEIVKLYFGISKTKEFNTSEIANVLNSNSEFLEKYNKGRLYTSGKLQKMLRQAKYLLANSELSQYY